MTTSGWLNSFVCEGMSLPTNGTASKRRLVGTLAPPLASSKSPTSLALSKPYDTRLILDMTWGTRVVSQSRARLIILSASSSASFSMMPAASPAPGARTRYARMWWSAMPRAAPCALSHSSAHSASNGMRSLRYQMRSSSTRCGVACSALEATAAFTAVAMRARIVAASLEPCASSAAERRRPTLKTASMIKNGSFQRKPSPEREVEKSSGTRRPSGQ
mmetsp:Transcript_16751/g.41240  ORF Transcript_16751/g.41240 Transcript_16751/m.41240 type:complete len:218 (-) Transcript_16751:877-1530(-)